jgi:N-acetylglucosamine kinase-like BadF-type ATPase
MLDSEELFRLTNIVSILDTYATENVGHSDEVIQEAKALKKKVEQVRQNKLSFDVVNNAFIALESKVKRTAGIV